jgi:hypothetical protein
MSSPFLPVWEMGPEARGIGASQGLMKDIKGAPSGDHAQA